MSVYAHAPEALRECAELSWSRRQASQDPPRPSRLAIRRPSPLRGRTAMLKRLWGEVKLMGDVLKIVGHHGIKLHLGEMSDVELGNSSPTSRPTKRIWHGSTEPPTTSSDSATCPSSLSRQRCLTAVSPPRESRATNPCMPEIMDERTRYLARSVPRDPECLVPALFARTASLMPWGLGESSPKQFANHSSATSKVSAPRRLHTRRSEGL
jgi:hypothetical protein